MLIESVSTGCGATKLVSSFDGSLAQWEEQHRCTTQGGQPHPKKGKVVAFQSAAKGPSSAK